MVQMVRQQKKVDYAKALADGFLTVLGLHIGAYKTSDVKWLYMPWANSPPVVEVLESHGHVAPFDRLVWR